VEGEGNEGNGQKGKKEERPARKREERRREVPCQILSFSSGCVREHAVSKA